MLITVLVEIFLSQWFIWLYFTLQALNKKEHKGCESPEPGADSDPYNGLRVDDKYDHRIPDDYQRVMQQNVMRVRSYRTIWVISYSYSPCNVALVVMFVYNLLAHTLHIYIDIYMVLNFMMSYHLVFFVLIFPCLAYPRIFMLSHDIPVHLFSRKPKICVCLWITNYLS